MICQNCGAQIGDNENFCGYCGMPVSTNTQPIYQGGAYVVQRKTNYKTLTIALIIAAVVIIALIITLVIVFSLGSREAPEDVAKRYFIAMTEMDYNTMCNCFALDLDGATNIMVEKNSYLKENLEEMYGTSNIREIYNSTEQREKIKSEYSSRYGDDYKISCEVISLTTLSESEKEKYLSEFKKSFFELSSDTESLDKLSALYKASNLDYAEEMCSVEMKTMIEGNQDKDSANFTVYCVKTNGAWKIITGMGDLNLNL